MNPDEYTEPVHISQCVEDVREALELLRGGR